MKWNEIFDKALRLGVENEIRELKENINNSHNYSNLYPDSAIITGSSEKDIKNLYVSIDADTAEVLLVHELIKSGLDIDGMISHHPSGKAYYLLPGVVEIQRDNWVKFGVKKSIADKILEKMIFEESIESKGNQMEIENACMKLNIPYMCIHTPIDNIVQNYFESLFMHKNNLTYPEAVEIVNNVPECIISSSNGDKPFIVNNPDKYNDPIGKFMVDMTGGVDPPDEIFMHLKKAGVDTLIGMHYGVDNIKAILKNGISAIICGHMACDSLGMNIFCDIIEKSGVNIIAGSGFYRYKRRNE